jgi:hypothetical protein
VVYGGTEWHMEVENQLSLIKKIYFQLTKDPEIMLFILKIILLMNILVMMVKCGPIIQHLKLMLWP